MCDSQFLDKRWVVILLTVAGLLNGMLLPVPASARAFRATTHANTTASAPAPAVSATTQARLRAAYGEMALRFERNQGQMDERVRFAARGGGYGLWLTDEGALLSLHRNEPRGAAVSGGAIGREQPSATAREAKAAVIRMKLVKANRQARGRGEEELPGRSNHFIGNDPGRWRSGVSNYAKVVYSQVYTGVDLVYYGKGGDLEYDFKMAAGANPEAIGWRIEGAQRLRIDAAGDLVISTAAGEVRQHRPVAYQEVGGKRRALAARYVMRGKDQVSFALGRYDRRKPLVIDPVLSYSTYLGGNSDDVAMAVAADAAGNAYVTGYTFSTDFPTVGGVQHTSPGVFDAFVAKLNPAGTALVYSTYLGGNGGDLGNGIAVDAGGNVYVTGMTDSDNFPTANPVQPHRNGVDDAFVTKLNAMGAALVYSTYLGGTKQDNGLSLAIDPAGNAYVAGSTHSTDFPTVNPLQPAYGGFTSDGFIAKLNPAGSALIYSTYLGGIGEDTAYAVAADAAGNAYVTGSTSSANFPTAAPLQPAFHGKTFFRSTNGGSNWSSLNTGLPAHLLVTGIAIDPTQPSILYAGTVGGVYKTTNGGASWSAVLNTSSSALAIDPVHPTTIYSTGAGVSKSTDGGATWAASGNLSQVTNTIVIDPMMPSTLYAGTNGEGVYKSTDGGATWFSSRTSFNRNTILTLAIDPSNTATIYAGLLGAADFGVYKSTDGGFSWNGPLLQFGRFSIDALVIDPHTPATIYAGTEFGPGIFKTTDGGLTWAFASNGLDSRDVLALAADPVMPNTIYAGTVVGVYKTTDGGANWFAVNNGLTSFAVQALAIDSAATLYAGTYRALDVFVTKMNASGSALVYSTYLGGDNSDGSRGIVADSAGNAYVTGYTLSRNFPVANALKSSLNEDHTDLFIAKLNPAGAGLVYSTYLGGSNDDVAYGVALDAAGNVSVAGQTFSADFPTTDPARAYAAGGDAFVTKLSGTGGAIIYSTYLGGHNSPNGDGQDQGNGVAVDANGNIYVAGFTQSADFPVTPGALQTALHNGIDAFVAKFGSFDICMQDETNGNLLQINSTSGDYRFTSCRKGIVYTGKGTVTVRGCKTTLMARASGQTLTALVNTCSRVATAELITQGKTLTITDNDMANNTCGCK
jgi:photosystem II stability/assembly factor-like uncharacterized protein